MLDRSRRRRPDRLGQALRRLAQGHASLQEIMADFGPGIQRGFDQVAAEFDAATKRMDEDRARTEEQFRETDARIRDMARENSQRSRELDERVGKLVLAIAELIRK